MSCRFPRQPIGSANPFKNLSTHLTREQNMRFLFPGVFLIPIRAALMATSLCTGVVFSKIATQGLTKEQLDRPLEGPVRTAAQLGIRMSVRAFLFSLGFHRIKLSGEKIADKSEAPIVVCNHIAPWEPLALYASFGVTFVAAAANYKIGGGIVGACMNGSQQLKLERDAPGSSGSAIKTAIVKRAMANDLPRLGIFPEGTTHNDTALITFKVAGAFSHGLPVQPILAIYRWRKTTGVDPSWCGGSVSLAMLVFRLMVQWENHLELRVLPVARPDESEKKSPAQFAERVRLQMAQALSEDNDHGKPVVVTEHSLEDMQLQLQAQKQLRGSTDDDAVLEFGRVKRQFSMEVSDIQMFLDSYHDMHKAGARGSGRPVISYQHFLAAMGLPDSPITRDVFLTVAGHGHDDSSDTSREAAKVATYNGDDAVNTDGKIKDVEHVTLDLRTFLKAAIVYSMSASESELDRLFSAIDTNGNRLLSLSEIQAVLAVAAPDVTEAQTEAMMKKFRDGSVSVAGRDSVDFIEFSAFLRSNPVFLCLFKKILARESDGVIVKARNEARRRRNAGESPEIKCLDEE